MTSSKQGLLHERLLQLAAETIETSGVHALSLRDVARRAGVSHASPVHHFGTREGLLTELATAGFESLTTALASVDGDLYDKGAAYVAWGVEHAGLYDVMWQTELLDRTDEHLIRARSGSWSQLAEKLGSVEEVQRVDAIAAFALVHGIVQLVRTKTEPQPDLDPSSLKELLRRLSPRRT